MSKVRVYIEPRNIKDLIEVSGRDTVHKLKNVLRLRKGQSLYVFDGKGREFLYKIESVEKKKVLLRKSSLCRENPGSGRKVVLAFPLTKESKIDIILQKSTELGVAGFIPYTCERSLKSELSASKLKRWSKIVMEAVRQSEALWPPFIGKVYSFKELLDSEYELKLAASIEGLRAEDIVDKNSEKALIVVGPEGDFSPSEYKSLKENGFKFISLSSNLLKVETAAVFSVGLIKYFLDES